MDPLAVLYEKYNILLEAKEDACKHPEEYMFAIERTKGSDQEKKLALQIITKFIKYFPNLHNSAINALIDLCEEPSDIIRMFTTKHLPLICKEYKPLLPKVVDILIQLIGLASSKDYNLTSSCLMQVFKENPQQTVKSIIRQINSSNEDAEREKMVQFLYKTIANGENKLTPEIHDILIEEGKKIISDSSATEFMVVMPYMISSKIAKTIAGQQELVNMAADRADLDSECKPYDESDGNFERIIMVVDTILPLFNAHVPSTKFVVYYCSQILPKWEIIGKVKTNEYKYGFLRQLAELSIHCGTLDDPQVHIAKIFDLLKLYMPQPPEDANVQTLPNLEFSCVECLLFAFHRLARQCPDFLTSNPLILKDFRSRLFYFARGIGGCKKSLEKASPQTLENEKAKIAPAMFNNITALIKDLFHTPPVYNCNVQLSFKSQSHKIIVSPSTTLQKRHVPIHFDSNDGASNKQSRMGKPSDNVKLYTPPGGKFSNNFQNYDRNPNRGRGRGGRGFRGGRGGSRGWRN